MTLREFASKVQDRKEELMRTINTTQKFIDITNEFNVDPNLFGGDMAYGEIARLMIIRESK